jgi:LPS export ABC transporter protein LptC
MMTGVRNTLWLLPLFLLVSWPVWGGYLVAFLSPRGSFETPATDSPGKTFTMQEVLFSQLKGGTEDWKIVTDRLFSLPGSEDVMRMESVDALLFEKGASKFHIVSGKGEYDMEKQVLVLIDKVSVEAKQGYTISSDLLQYHDQNKEIRTDEKVQINTEDMDIRGTGLLYNMQTGAYRVDGRVEFNIK